MSGVSAALKAGYTYSYVNSGRLAKRTGDDIALALEKAGFNNQFISDRIVQRVDHKNASVGHKYFETGLKLAGKLRNDSGLNVDKMQVNVYLPDLSKSPPENLNLT